MDQEVAFLRQNESLCAVDDLLVMLSNPRHEPSYFAVLSLFFSLFSGVSLRFSLASVAGPGALREKADQPCMGLKSGVSASGGDLTLTLTLTLTSWFDFWSYP